MIFTKHWDYYFQNYLNVFCYLSSYLCSYKFCFFLQKPWTFNAKTKSVGYNYSRLYLLYIIYNNIYNICLLIKANK